MVPGATSGAIEDMKNDRTTRSARAKYATAAISAGREVTRPLDEWFVPLKSLFLSNVNSVSSSDSENGDCTVVGAGGSGCGGGDQGPDIIIDELCDVFEKKAIEANLEVDGLDDFRSDPTASGSGAPPPPVVAPPPAHVPYWETLGPPDALGYIMDAGRMAGRLQYTEDRTWVNCYRYHTGCRLNVATVGGPSQREVFEWLYSVPAGSPTMPSAERKALAQQHMKIARDKWSMKARRPLENETKILI